MQKLVIHCNGKRHKFSGLVTLGIQIGNEMFVYSSEKSSDAELRFVRAFAGWRDRYADEHLIEFRKKKWGTQAKAAKALGVTQSYLSKIEKGEREMTVEMMVKYIEAGLDHISSVLEPYRR